MKVFLCIGKGRKCRESNNDEIIEKTIHYNAILWLPKKDGLAYKTRIYSKRKTITTVDEKGER